MPSVLLPCNFAIPSAAVTAVGSSAAPCAWAELLSYFAISYDTGDPWWEFWRFLCHMNFMVGHCWLVPGQTHPIQALLSSSFVLLEYPIKTHSKQSGELKFMKDRWSPAVHLPGRQALWGCNSWLQEALLVSLFLACLPHSSWSWDISHPERSWGSQSCSKGAGAKSRGQRHCCCLLGVRHRLLLPTPSLAFSVRISGSLRELGMMQCVLSISHYHMPHTQFPVFSKPSTEGNHWLGLLCKCRF